MNQNPFDIDEHLLLKYLTGEADALIRREVEAWLEADAGNRGILDRLESLWLEAGRLDPPPMAVDTDAAWNRLSARLEMADDRAGAAMRKPRLRFMRFAMAAAAAVLLIFGTWAVLRLITGAPEMIEMAATNTVLHDTLPDGSRITLNTASKLVYPEKFEGRTREVKLTGEAFFEVTRDSMQPFVVDADPARIKVLGTAFRVKALPGEAVEVHVATGRVMLFRIDPRTADTTAVILEAGQHGLLRVHARQPEVVELAAPDDLFWANRSLDFSGTPLQEVIGMLEKYYGIRVTVSNPDILLCRLSATFADEPPARIMTVIAESFGLQLSAEGSDFHLTGDGCAKAGQ
jgi:ferric-dicitrate binding protein FerR (iron transport regulator)